MDANLSVAWGLMLVAKAIWILIIPVVVVIAAAKLWHSCPRWLPVVFLTSAVVSVAASAPQLLLVLHKITSQQYGQIAMGINRGMANMFEGEIDDVRVYNRALSDAEIAGLAGLTESVPVSF